MIRIILVCWVLIFNAGNNVAMAHFFNEHEVGYWWYQDDAKEQRDKPQQQAIGSKEAHELIKSIKQEFQYRQELAFLYPTHENVRKLRILQKKLFDQANMFSNEWLYVSAVNPELDETIDFPISQTGATVLNDQKNAYEEALLKNFAKTHGLMFFYQSNCPYCHTMAPILQNFAKRFDWNILPISLDGQMLQEFPNSKIDSGQARAFGITKLPALVVADTKNNQALAPIYGLLTQDLLIKRLVLLIEGDRQHV
jgi:conjugal transfer pilus assembly protein TraF